MIKHILVPTDFSKCAEQATKFAVNLAKLTGAKIDFLTCFQIPVVTTDITYTYDVEIVKKFQEDSEERFKELTQRMPDLSKISFDTHVDLGYPQETILEKTKTADFDLLVMGTKGASGMGAQLLGSITSTVIERSEVPVLAIPENWKDMSFGKVSLASDYHELPHFDKLTILVDLLSIFQAELHIVNVKTSVSETSFDEAYEAKKLDDFLTGISHSFHSVIGDDLSESLENFLKVNGIDLLAMLPREHSFLERLFGKSETRRVALHTQTPLLSLRV